MTSNETKFVVWFWKGQLFNCSSNHAYKEGNTYMKIFIPQSMFEQNINVVKQKNLPPLWLLNEMIINISHSSNSTTIQERECWVCFEPSHD